MRSLAQWSRARARSLWSSEFTTVAAVSVWIGASGSLALPMWVGLVFPVSGCLSRRRPLILVGLVVGAAVLSHHARAGLVPVASGAWSGWVELVGDPVSLPGRVLVDASTGIGRVQLTATGSAASALRRAHAGQRIDASGTLRELRHPSRVASRHLRMAFDVDEASIVGGEDLWRLPVDAVRSSILRSAAALPAAQRSVYTGFVIGDDRGSDADVTRAFEDSGLSHLLVVSGENVVFVTAVITSALSRFPRRVRLLGIVAVLLLFAAVTRFEPSVMRAATMAIIAVLATGSGRPIESRRRLTLAIVLLLLIDPLLVESFGFRLSVAASAGITLIAPRLTTSLRGPLWFRQVVAVTIAAQVSVAPLIVPVFGSLPLASLPANVLAEPVAGFVMMYGSSLGLLAGVVGGPVAIVIQLPVRLAVWWIMGVAEICADLPLPHVGIPALVVIILTSLGAARLRRVLTWARRRHSMLDTAR